MTPETIITALTAVGLDAQEAWCDEDPVTSVDLTVADGVLLRLTGPDYTAAAIHVLGADGLIEPSDLGDPEADTATVVPAGTTPDATAAAWADWRTRFLTEFPTPWSYLNLAEHAYIDAVGPDYRWGRPTPTAKASHA